MPITAKHEVTRTISRTHETSAPTPLPAADSEWAERRAKRDLWTARSSLAADARTQRTAARLLRSENRRLGGELAALQVRFGTLRCARRLSGWCSSAVRVYCWPLLLVLVCGAK